MKCSIDDCDKEARGRGWCGKHYMRWNTRGDPLIETKYTNEGKICCAENCNKPAKCRELCSTHYARWRTHGDPNTIGTKRVDHTGTVFGFLTVVKLIESKRKTLWECKCLCGGSTITPSERLVSGKTVSCGCRTGQDPKTKTIGRVRYLYERNAKERNIDFLLTDGEIEKLIFENCDYCGSEPSNNIKGLAYGGIDRVINEQPYEINNCVPCCGVCNMMKRHTDLEDFLTHIKKIYNHRN